MMQRIFTKSSCHNSRIIPNSIIWCNNRAISSTTTSPFSAEGLMKSAATKVLSTKLQEDTSLWLGTPSVSQETESVLDPSPGCFSGESLKPLPSHKNDINPFDLVASDIANVNDSILQVLGTDDHPVLSRVATYFFDTKVNVSPGKKVRPTMILLLAKAAAAAADSTSTDLIERAQRVAEITEMIHTATLLHDDVLDDADSRRGISSAKSSFGSKMSILAGDYLLARSSICLASLNSIEAVTLMSTAIEHLVKGEVMQMNNNSSSSKLEYYLRKNYYKTASLMANGCAASMEVSFPEVRDVAFAYGRHIGNAFQLVDDVLDFHDGTGKEALADLKSGLATAPVILSDNVTSEMMTDLKKKNGNSSEVLAAVKSSNGIDATMAIARGQVELAVRALSCLESSPAKDALVSLAYRVLDQPKKYKLVL